MDDWHYLGLDGPTDDVPAIRRAYAQRLRVTHPDDDAEAYQVLRAAYDRLMQRARAPRPEAREREVQDLTAASRLPEHPVAPSADQLATLLRDEGPTSVRHRTPDLLRQLHVAPLDQQGSMSADFAELVIACDDLPFVTTAALHEHFDWQADYRLARTLGEARLEALLNRLRDLPSDADERLGKDLGRELLHTFGEGEESGEAAVQAFMPELMAELAGLSGDTRPVLSRRFADVVLARPELPTSTLLTLRDHFGWRSPHCVMAVNGGERARRLGVLLDDLVEPVTDPAVLAAYRDLTDLDAVLRQNRPARRFAVALHMTDHLRRLVRSAGWRLMMRLGIGHRAQQQVQGLLAVATAVQVALLASLLFTVAVWNDRAWHSFVDVSLVLGATLLLPGLARAHGSWREGTVSAHQRYEADPGIRHRVRVVQRAGLSLLMATALVLRLVAPLGPPGASYMLAMLALLWAAMGSPEDPEATAAGLGLVACVWFTMGTWDPATLTFVTLWLLAGIALFERGGPAQVREAWQRHAVVSAATSGIVCVFAAPALGIAWSCRHWGAAWVLRTAVLATGALWTLQRAHAGTVLQVGIVTGVVALSLALQLALERTGRRRLRAFVAGAV